MDKYRNHTISPESSQIFEEKIAILYRNLLISIPANFLCALIEFISLLPINNSKLVMGWFVITIIVSLFRFISFFFYQNLTKNTSLQYSIFFIGTFLSAALWGFVASFLMPRENLIEQMVTIVMVAGITAGGIQSLQASLLISLVYVVTSVLPLTVWLFLQSGSSYLILGFAITTYLFFMIIASVRGNHILVNSLKLRFQNLDLIANLSKANNELNSSLHTIDEAEKRLLSIQENAPIGMAIVSLDGKFLQVNRAMCEITGYSKDEFQSLSLKDINHPDDYLKVFERIDNLLSNKLVPRQAERRYLHKNGKYIWVMVNVTLIKDSLGKPNYFISQVEDITDEKNNAIIQAELSEKTNNMLAELQLRELEMGIIHKMNEFLLTCDHSTDAYEIISHTASEIFPEMSGGLFQFNSLENQMEMVIEWGKIKILKKKFNLSDCWGLREGHLYHIADPAKELLCHHFSTAPVTGTLCMPQIHEKGFTGMIVLIGNAGEDISSFNEQLAMVFNDTIRLALSNIHLREKLLEQSIHDSLTTLYNRRYLDEMLPRKLKLNIQEKQKLYVSMIDIDFFKRFNDTHGHEAGDEVLKSVGTILREEINGSDLACRFGGEEFILIFTHTNKEKVLAQLENLREKIKNTPIFFQEKLLPPVTISIGMAEAPTDGRSPKEIVQVADEALYQAKQQGRDRIVVYTVN